MLEKSEKKRLTAFFLCLFLGGLGVHRFYVGKIGTGILWLFTCGLFGFGAFIDLIMILAGRFMDKKGYYVKNWTAKNENISALQIVGIIAGMFVVSLFVLISIGRVVADKSPEMIGASQTAKAWKEPAPQVEKTEPEPVKKSESINYIKSGMYKVGSDIPAGEYLIFSESTFGAAYWEISKDSSGSLKSIIANDNLSTFAYADLRNGDYFKLVSAKAIKRDLFPYKPIEKEGVYTEGTYKIGLDIEPGEYKLTRINESPMAYWERAKSARGSLNAIIANDNFDSSAYVTVRYGEYFKIVGSKAEKVK